MQVQTKLLWKSTLYHFWSHACNIFGGSFVNLSVRALFTGAPFQAFWVAFKGSQLSASFSGLLWISAKCPLFSVLRRSFLHTTWSTSEKASAARTSYQWASNSPWLLQWTVTDKFTRAKCTCNRTSRRRVEKKWLNVKLWIIRGYFKLSFQTSVISVSYNFAAA